MTDPIYRDPYSSRVMLNPVRLPCSHVHDVKTVESSQDKCPTCSQRFDVQVLKTADNHWIVDQTLAKQIHDYLRKNPSEAGQLLLEESSSSNPYNFLRLLHICPNPNVQNQFRQTPLMLATLAQQTQNVLALLERDVNVLQIDIKGHTALILVEKEIEKQPLSATYSPLNRIAFLLRNAEAFAFITNDALNKLHQFIAAGGDVNMRCEGKCSLLYHALVKCSNIDAAQILVRAGADINEVDKEGNTLLFPIALMGRARIIKEMLQMGFDPTITNNQGQTVLMVVEDKIRQLQEEHKTTQDSRSRMDLQHQISFLKKTLQYLNQPVL